MTEGHGAVNGICPHCGKECDNRDPLSSHLANAHGGPGRGLAPGDRRALGCVLSVLGVVLVAVLATASHSGHARAPTPTTALTPAHVLASLEDGPAPPAEDVAHFTLGLDTLAQRCTNTREDLADLVVATHDYVRRKGRAATYEQVLDSAVEAVPESWGRDCAEVFAGWATVYLSGR